MQSEPKRASQPNNPGRKEMASAMAPRLTAYLNVNTATTLDKCKRINKSKAAVAPMVDAIGKPYQVGVSAVEASNLCATPNQHPAAQFN